MTLTVTLRRHRHRHHHRHRRGRVPPDLLYRLLLALPSAQYRRRRTSVRSPSSPTSAIPEPSPSRLSVPRRLLRAGTELLRRLGEEVRVGRGGRSEGRLRRRGGLGRGSLGVAAGGGLRVRLVLPLGMVVLAGLVGREGGEGLDGRGGGAVVGSLGLLLEAGRRFVPAEGTNGLAIGEKVSEGKEDAPSEILKERGARLVRRDNAKNLETSIVGHFLSVAGGSTVRLSTQSVSSPETRGGGKGRRENAHWLVLRRVAQPNMPQRREGDVTDVDPPNLEDALPLVACPNVRGHRVVDRGEHLSHTGEVTAAGGKRRRRMSVARMKELCANSELLPMTTAKEGWQGKRQRTSH